MTTSQLTLLASIYAAAFIAVVYLTRATTRRVLGALVGGVVAGGFFSALALLGATVGWWRVEAFPSTVGLLALFYLATAISLTPIYPITWRVARRFHGPGLTVCLIASALVGPPRDYLVAAVYPEWVVFAPGLAPVGAASCIYVGVVALGHVTMRFVAGPANGDRLVQRS